MSGWFSVQRNIFEHPYFKGEKYTRLDAWLWMLNAAAWKDTGHDIRGNYHEVKRGSFFTTVRDLMKYWGWGNTKVSGFLLNLEKQDMIQVSQIHGKTLINIVNYEQYQSKQDTDKTTARQPQDTKETRKPVDKGVRPPKKSGFGLSSIATQMAEEVREKKYG